MHFEASPWDNHRVGAVFNVFRLFLFSIFCASLSVAALTEEYIMIFQKKRRSASIPVSNFNSLLLSTCGQIQGLIYDFCGSACLNCRSRPDISSLIVLVLSIPLNCILLSGIPFWINVSEIVLNKASATLLPMILVIPKNFSLISCKSESTYQTKIVNSALFKMLVDSLVRRLKSSAAINLFFIIVSK